MSKNILDPPYRVDDAEFVIGAVSPKDYPSDLPGIAIAGRSNVGKSSLINFLCNRRKLVKASRQPGKTKEINFFRINSLFYLVDIPGLGYAKVAKTLKQTMGERITAYFSNSKTLCAVFYLIDIRVIDSKIDEAAITWLSEHHIPIYLIVTKSDKLKKQQKVKAISEIKSKYGLTESPIVSSVLKNIGRDEIWELITRVIV